jgi:hypothetical protein
VYESVFHDGTDVVFGIDLVKWAGEIGWAAVRVPEDEKKKDAIPPVLSSLLQALDVSYGKLASDEGVVFCAREFPIADLKLKNGGALGFTKFPSRSFITFERLLTDCHSISPFPSRSSKRSMSQYLLVSSNFGY